MNKKLLQYCNRISSKYLPIVEQVQCEGKEIIIIWCSGGETRHYKSPGKVSYKKGERSLFSYYIRKISNSIKANQFEKKTVPEKLHGTGLIRFDLLQSLLLHFDFSFSLQFHFKVTVIKIRERYGFAEFTIFKPPDNNF